MLLTGGLACTERRLPVPPSNAPLRRPPAELVRLIRSQAYESRLSIDGLAFADSTLYVATNIGLLEVRDHAVAAIDQWPSDENVVSGPWADAARRQLWVLRVRDNTFRLREGASWRAVPPPSPEGGYTRGDVLEGFRAAADSAAFRLVGAGHVWRWADSSWVAEPNPPVTGSDGVVGAAFVGGRALVMTSSGGCGYLSCTNRAFWREGADWGPALAVAVSEIAEVIVATDGASEKVYMRGTDGGLLRADRDSLVRVSTPGPCEAIARGSGGRLLASFRDAGIFTADGQGWRKRFDDPTRGAPGKQRAYIAEFSGVVALATTTVPNLKPGTNDEWFESGTLGLWISDSTGLRRVSLSP